MLNKSHLVFIVICLTMTRAPIASAQESDAVLSTQGFDVSNENEIQTSLPEAPAAKDTKPWQLDFIAEMSSKSSSIEMREPKSASGLDDLSIGVKADLARMLKSNVELSTLRARQDQQQEHHLLVKRAYLDFEALTDHVTLRAGQDMLPIGFLNEDEYRYSRNPTFYSALMPSEKFADLGVKLNAAPFRNKLLSIEAGVYSGESERFGEGRKGSAQIRPRVLSLKSESKYHEAYVSYLRHELAFFDSVTAYGAGLKLSTAKMLPLDFELQLISELWTYTHAQSSGPNENSVGFFVDPSVRFKWLTLGTRFERTESRLPSMDQTLTPVQGILYHAALDFSYLRLQFEKVKQVQNETLADESVLRLLFKYAL